MAAVVEGVQHTGIRVETGQPDGGIDPVDQKGVNERQNRVDGVGGGPPHPLAKAVIVVESLAQSFKITSARRPFESTQGVEILGIGEFVEQNANRSGGTFGGVGPAATFDALKDGEHVAQLAAHDVAGDSQAKGVIASELELAAAQQDVFRLGGGQSSPITAVLPQKDGVDAFAQKQRQGGSGEGNVAAKHQLFELADEQGVVDVVSKADEQMPPFADDAGSLSGDVNDHDHAPWNEKDESHFA